MKKAEREKVGIEGRRPTFKGLIKDLVKLNRKKKNGKFKAHGKTYHFDPRSLNCLER